MERIKEASSLVGLGGLLMAGGGVATQFDGAFGFTGSEISLVLFALGVTLTVAGVLTKEGGK